MNTEAKKSCCFRLVVKFRKYALPTGLKDHEINDFFLKDHLIPWRRITELVPGIRINKLIRSVSLPTIDHWIKKAMESDFHYQQPDFFSYYALTWDDQVNTREILQMLVNCKNVELAYVQHGSIRPPSFAETFSLSFHQAHLNAAPDGINAKYGWAFKGGDGTGNIKFIDIEQGWLPKHESIVLRDLSNRGINCVKYRDHGTAVLGIIMMRKNKSGGRGITPRVNGSIISQWRPDGRMNTADAIIAAIEHLNFGDILLLEAQTSDTDPAYKLWPVEIEDAVYQAIRLATALGITVIEAAGNGNNQLFKGNDLDRFQLNSKKILNPRSKDYRDSGAILVAAASCNAPHLRRANSNYGNRVNCYASGENVLTAGNYPRSSRSSVNMYTYNFCGTSSAAAIIAGAAISIQSIAAANIGRRLDPIEMRNVLSAPFYNTPSANGCAKDKIGVMPDLKEIITKVFNINPSTNTSQKKLSFKE